MSSPISRARASAWTSSERTRFDRPGTVLHGRFTVRRGSDGKSGIPAFAGIPFATDDSPRCHPRRASSRSPAPPLPTRRARRRSRRASSSAASTSAGSAPSRRARGSQRTSTGRSRSSTARKHWTVSLDQLGAGASVDAAVAKALDARPGATFGLSRSLVEQEGAAVRRRHREGHRPAGREREPRQRLEAAAR